MKTKLLLFIVLSNSTCFAQTARDYFFPAPGKNVSVYVLKGIPGVSKDGEKKFVYFKDMGDSALMTTLYPTDERNSWTEEAVKIEDSKISFLRIKTKAYGASTYEPDEMILLKMPPDGKSSSEDISRGNIKRTVKTEFLTITIDGKEKKALRVTQSSKVATFSNYYVQGMGLYKRTSGNGTQLELLTDQKYERHPPKLK
jgi:hypothetical protein